MSSKHNHEESYELLAAYALNAVDVDERAQMEAFLDANPEYQAELDEYRAAAALLAIGHQAVPSQLWERIQSQVEPTAPPLRLIDEQRSARRETRQYKIASAVMSAAAVVLVAVLATVMVKGSPEPEPDSLAALAAAASTTPGARAVSMSSADKVHNASVVLTADGHGYLANSNLPDLPSGETYQLWAFTDSGLPVSVAVLGTRADDAAFMAAASISTFAITVEKTGGVAAPTSMPIISAALA